MEQYRFRFARDFDISASSPKEALQVLKDVCAENGITNLDESFQNGSFQCLGKSIPDAISKADVDRVSPLVKEGITLMSCQYRGENFTVICKKREVDDTRVALQPIALVLREQNLDCLVDIKGDLSVQVKEELK